MGGWYSKSSAVLDLNPWVGLGGGPPSKSLSQWHVAHCSRPSPAPFSGVKQEQLSPRGQAGPPESLGVPTAQETSVLRGEGMRGGCEAWSLPCIPSSCSSALWRRVEAGTGSFIQSLLSIVRSQRVQKPLFIMPHPFRGRGSSALRHQGDLAGQQDHSPLGKGCRHPLRPASHVF